MEKKKTYTSNGDIPTQPTNREARSDLYECAKYAHTLLMKSSRFPRRKTGRRPQMTAIVWVKKHETPMTKTPHPSPPLSALYDMLNCLAISAYPGEIIGPWFYH